MRYDISWLPRLSDNRRQVQTDVNAFPCLASRLSLSLSPLWSVCSPSSLLSNLYTTKLLHLINILKQGCVSSSWHQKSSSCELCSVWSCSARLESTSYTTEIDETTDMWGFTVDKQTDRRVGRHTHTHTHTHTVQYRQTDRQTDRRAGRRGLWVTVVAFYN